MIDPDTTIEIDMVDKAAALVEEGPAADHADVREALDSARRIPSGGGQRVYMALSARTAARMFLFLDGLDYVHYFDWSAVDEAEQSIIDKLYAEEAAERRRKAFQAINAMRDDARERHRAAQEDAADDEE
jgi:hypothetical protein